MTCKITSSKPLATIRTTEAGEVRVSLDVIDGVERVNIRRWYRRGDGVWMPTPKGITVATDHLEELATALDHARKAAGR